MKIARIPYLNAEPYYVGWGAEPPFEVVDMLPRALGEAAPAGEIDGGLMAVADYFALDDTFEMVRPPMGVAAQAHVRSVILFSKRAPQRLGGARIGVTGESSTSRALLKLLARAYWRIDDVTWVPEAEITGDPAAAVDALLLIGDRALEAIERREATGWSQIVDLATEWWMWQGLPFVFAVWAVRRSLPRRERERFAGFLSGSLAVGGERLERIAAEHAGPMGSASRLQAYLEHFTYRLGSREQTALARFRALVTGHGLDREFV